VSQLRLLDDVIELDGQPIARLVPNLCLSLRDRLIAAFDALDEGADDITDLENTIAQLESRIAQREARIAQMEERLKAPAR
jgi:hypothetical protein